MTNDRVQGQPEPDAPADTQPRAFAVPLWASLGSGLILTALGLTGMAQGWFDRVPALVVLCCGLGVSLAALGATATYKRKGLVLTGSIAIAMVILLSTVKILASSFVAIQLKGDITGARVAFLNATAYTRDLGHGRQEVIVMGPDIRSDHVTLIIDLTDHELDFECVRKSEIEPYFGSGKTLEWRVTAGDSAGLWKGTELIARVGPACPPDKRIARWSLPSIVQSAHALQPADLQRHLRDLDSPSTTVRRNAQAALVAMGVSSVQPLLQAWSSAPSYQVRLGVLTTFDGLLRNGAVPPAELSRRLSDHDVTLLVSARADRDPSIRAYAEDVLSRLRDPRAPGSRGRE